MEARKRFPYSPLRPAIHNFVGRREIWFDDFRLRLHRREGYDRHLIILGPSGIGKTSLLKRIERQAVEGEGLERGRVAYIDLGRPRIEPLEVVQAIYDALPLTGAEGKARSVSFLRRLAEATTLKPPGAEIELGALLGAQKTQTMDAAFDLLLQALNDLPTDESVVIILDQLGVAGERAALDAGNGEWHQFLQGLDGVLCATCGPDHHVLFLMGIREERLGTLIRVAGRLWNGYAIHVQPLGPLKEQEARDLITLPAGEAPWRVSYDPETVDLLIQWVGLSPYDLQLACFYVWEWLRKEERLEPGIRVRLSREELGQAIGGELQARFWNLLAPDEREVLKLVAQYQPSQKDLAKLAGEKGIHDVKPIVEALQAHDLQPLQYLSREDRYLVAHDLLREFIETQIPEDEQALAVLRRALRDAPQRYAHGGALFTETELEKLWLLRDQLEPTPEELYVVLLSEAYRLEWGEEIVPTLTKWGRHFPDQGLRALTQLAQSAEYQRVRYEAAQALAELGETGVAIPVLTQLAQSAEDGWVRYEAAQALAGLGETQVAIPALTQLAQSAEDELVRYETAQALAGLGEIAIPALTQLAQSAEHERVRYEAARSLAEFGETQIAIPVLTQLAQSAEDELVRYRAAQALAELGETGVAIPTLTQLAQSAEDWRVRYMAAQALTELSQTQQKSGN